MQSDLYEMEWIDENAMLALANTVVLDDPGRPGSAELDLLAISEARAVWRDKVQDARLADLELPALMDLRRDVRSALDAIDRAISMPEEVRLRLNALAEGAPCTVALDPSGRLRTVELSESVAGRVARETLQAVGAAANRARAVRRCPAPRCGMFFVPGRRDQSWCTVRCGTRARATRLRKRTQGAG